MNAAGGNTSSQSSATSSSSANSSSASSSKDSSESQSSASSQTHGNNVPNVTPDQSDDIVNSLQPKVDKLGDDVNKYADSDDPAVIDVLSDASKAADEITDAVNDYIFGKATPADTENVIKSFKNKIADLQKQIANEKNPTVKAILQDELDAYQATVNKLEAYLNKNTAKADNVTNKTNKVNATANNSAKVPVSKASSHVSAMNNKKVAKNEKVMKSNLDKKSTMPQTGEANNSGVLAGIGALILAAAGAFLFRKRG